MNPHANACGRTKRRTRGGALAGSAIATVAVSAFGLRLRRAAAIRRQHRLTSFMSSSCADRQLAH